MSFFLGGLFSCVVYLNTQTEVVERFWLHVPNIAPLVVSPLCVLLLALSVLPWYRFWYQRQRIREQLRRFSLTAVLKALLPVVIAEVFVFIAVGCLVIFFPKLMQWFKVLLEVLMPKILSIVGVLSAVAFVLALLIYLARNCRLTIGDRVVLHKSSLSSVPLTRIDIEQTLSQFRLMRSRLSYLREIYNSGAKPTGDWSQGYPPNFDGDRSGDLLAILEARWLGVER
jgi:hypothetical protein